MFKLKAFQEKAVADILKNAPEHQKQCLAFYTGAGKTEIYAELCKRILKKNPKALIGISAYHTTEIKDQIAERFDERGLGDYIHVINSPDKTGEDKNIIIFNPLSLYVAIPEIKFDWLIIDEAHVGVGEHCKMLTKIMMKTTNKKTRFLLGSATPWDTLALEEFKDCKVYKRTLDQGLKDDDQIVDYSFVAEEAQIEFSEENFNRRGDLSLLTVQKRMRVLKSACIGKLKHIIKKYDHQLGKKVIVICPPGNLSEIASTMAQEFKGLAFLQKKGHANIRQYKTYGKGRILENTDLNLAKFKEDPSIRFLFVTNKCQIGFDYQQMSAIVDLTMSRNITTLCQRTGRIARKNGKQEKAYFYVYDKSLGQERLDWVILTLVDIGMGFYDGLTSRKMKFRPVNIMGMFNFKEQKKISEIIHALSLARNYKEARVVKFVQYDGTKIRKYTLDVALANAAKYENRTELWINEPALLRWLRFNANDELDMLFPKKMKYWPDEKVAEIIKSEGHLFESRKKFWKAYPGIEYKARLPRFKKLLDKHCPGMPDLQQAKWTHEKAIEKLKTVYDWKEIRNTGFRHWLGKNGGERMWKDKWRQMVPRKRAA